MSSLFPKFTSSEGGDVFINPTSVRYFNSLYEGHDQNLTNIIFDNDHSITVVSSLEDVQMLLAK